MPIYRPSRFEYEVSRRAIILDTCVLVAAFDSRDQRHEDTNAFLDLVVEDQLIVPWSVIIETWGMLVGRGKRWDSGYRFLTWLGDTSKVTVILQDVESFDSIKDMVKTARVDCVDAAAMQLGHGITEQCNLRPSIRIATYDTGDFLKCISSLRLKITLFDLNTMDEEEYEVY